MTTRIITALTLALLLIFTQPLSILAETLSLEEGTQVRLKLLKSITSSSREGKSVEFEVANHIYTDDEQTILIKAGTPAKGTITEARGKGFMGQKGQMAVVIESTQAVDGSEVPLRGSVSRSGRSRMATSLALTVFLTPLTLLPVFLLIPGQDARLAAGSMVDAYVDRPVKVSIQGKSKTPAAEIAAKVSSAKSEDTKPATEAVPDYLKKYMDTPAEPSTNPETEETLKALEQLHKQGLLTTEELEIKKQALQKR